MEYAKWLLVEPPATGLICICSMPNGLVFYLDGDALKRNIPYDLFAYATDKNQWYIMDERGEEI